MTDSPRRNQLLCSPLGSPLGLIPRKLFPNDVPELFLYRIIAPANVLAQGVIHHGLVVAPSRLVGLVAKPIQNLFVDSNGYATLTGGQRIDGSPHTFAEIIVFLHNSAFIFSTLTSICRSGRDNPNMLSPPRMDDDKNTPICIASDCSIPVLSLRFTRYHNRMDILENSRRVSKLDAVLLQI
jgi:hypothetical protein